jgi:hypothetical protein
VHTVLVRQKGKTNNTPAIPVQHGRGKNLLHSCNSLKSPTNNTVLTYHTKEFHTFKTIKKCLIVVVVVVVVVIGLVSLKY